MSQVVLTRDLSKHFQGVAALDQVSFSLTENRIYGLLGRNGAGKTTLMRVLTGQTRATSGEVAVFGAPPFENATVLERICFVKESQTYPQYLRVEHALRAAGLVFPHWDEEFARSLLAEFRLPPQRHVRRLSRGMLSALGIVIGLASRAPLTFFDEPYLGLDAVARQLFYDHLLADYTEHPRTIVLSTHLIDEVSELIEHVLLIDQGRLVLDGGADTLRGQVVTVTGAVPAVDEFTSGGQELHRSQLGNTARATVRGASGPAARERAQRLGLTLEPVSLQELVVRVTTGRNAAGQADTGGSTAGHAGTGGNGPGRDGDATPDVRTTTEEVSR